MAKKQKKEPDNVKDMSSEALGLLLGEELTRMMQVQNNVNVIRAELERRKDKDD